MDLTKVLRILSTNAKAATIAGVAVAATAGGGAVVATTVADSTPTTTSVTTSSDTQGDDANEAPEVKDSESPDPQDTESPDAAETKDAAKTVTPVDCGTTTWANHGAFVKSVAQASPSPDASSNAHGLAVSAAAQSDCGKPTPGATKPAHTATGQANAATHKSAVHGKSATHRHHH
jgi:hypothetical protein